MGLMILATGIFAGIAISIASFYSVAQVLLTQGQQRLAHLAALLLTLAAMAALQYGSVPLARVMGVPLLLAGFWAFVHERRWFRLFPLIQQLFAAVLLAGLVEL